MFKNKWGKSRGKAWKVLAALFMAIVLISSVILAGCTPSTPEVITLRFSSPYMEFEPPAVFGLHVCDLVEEKMGERVVIERYTGGTLANVPEHLGLVSSGAVDLITLHVDQYPQDLPLHRILNSDQLCSREQSVANLIAITQEIPETKAILDAEQERNNIKILSWVSMGTTALTTREPATSISDMVGKKVNVITAYQRDVFEELGWIPVNVQIPELYEALSRGVIDAIFMATGANVPLKWYEISKSHLILGDVVVCSQPIAFNLDTWNSLPDDVQQAFLDASLETAMWSIEHDKEIAEMTYEVFGEAGVDVVSLPQEEVDTWFAAVEKHAIAVCLENCRAAGVEDEVNVLLPYWREMMWGRWQG